MTYLPCAISTRELLGGVPIIPIQKYPYLVRGNLNFFCKKGEARIGTKLEMVPKLIGIPVTVCIYDKEQKVNPLSSLQTIFISNCVLIIIL